LGLGLLTSVIALELVRVVADHGTFLMGFEFRRLNPGPVVDETGRAVGFWWFFDASTRSIAMRGKELGLVGYGYRALELVGFLAGGLGGPLAMSARSHCAGCNRYRRSRLLAMVPYQHDVDGILVHLGDAARMRDEITSRGPTEQHVEFRRLGERFILRLLFCPRCRAGSIVVEKLGGPAEQRSGLAIHTEPVGAELVTQLLG
jgi:hypothetical protein